MALEGFHRDVDLQEMRMIRREMLIHRAIVIEVQSSRVALGFAQSETAVQRNVACLYQPTTGEMSVRTSEALEAIASGVVTFDANDAILPNHRLYITGKMNGVSFAKRVAVVSVNVPRSAGIALKAVVTDDASLAGAGPPPA